MEFRTKKHFITSARRTSESSPQQLSDQKQSEIISRIRAYRARQRKVVTPSKNRTEISPRPKTKVTRATSGLFSSVIRGESNLKSQTLRRLSKEKIFIKPVSPLHAKSKSTENLQKYLDNLKNFERIKLDLEYLFEISRKIEIHDLKPVGDVSRIQEKVTDSSENYQDILKDSSVLLRDIFKAMMQKDLQKETIALEALWRITVKLFDNFIETSNEKKIIITKKSEEKLTQLRTEYKQKRIVLKESLSKIQSETKDIIKHKEAFIKSLQNQNHCLEKTLRERDIELASLTEVESREEACEQMNKMLDKMNTYISETERHQVKQARTLYTLSKCIEVAQEVKNRKVSENTEVQTKISMLSLPFEMLNEPLLSFHPLYTLYISQDHYEMTSQDAFKICEAVLDENITGIPFVKQVLLFLAKSGQPDPQRVVVGLYMHLRNNQSSKHEQLMWLLMGNLPLSAEHVLIKLFKMFPRGLVSLGRAVELLEEFFHSDREAYESIVSNIDWICSDSSLPIMCRFFFAVERTKKNLRNLLEPLENRKDAAIPRTVFIDWMKSKLGLWARDSEYQIIIDKLEGNKLKVQSIFEQYRALELHDKARDIFTDTEEVLLQVAFEYIARLRSLVNSYEFVEQCKNFQEFTHHILKIGKDPYDYNHMNLYADYLLLKPLGFIIRDTQDMSLFKLKSKKK